jgi:GT2 family glycosyltransferase
MTRISEAQHYAAVWLGWNGHRLRWRVDAVLDNRIEVELCIDGDAFERSAFAVGEFEREFAYSPSGCEQIEFSLRAVGAHMLAPPWRVRFGHAAPTSEDQWSGAPPRMQTLADAPLPVFANLAEVPVAAIVVPIYNAAQCVQRCIAAVLRWTQGPARLILIDDASDDPGIAPLLAQYAGLPGVTVLRNPRNLGYTRTSNLGIELAGGADVVLLNADTEVGPRWLDRLRLTAYADPAIGTVTAVSDNAGAFSVPELERYCPIPSRWTLTQAQRALLQQVGGCLPELPTGNGFCMHIKRAMLDRIGILDAAAFPSGYGEENDLCQRAERVGFRHVIAGDVFVHHERSASFGDARRAALGAQGMTVLRARYPDYEAKVGATLYSFSRRVLDYRVRRVYADRDGVYATFPPRPRVLLACAAGRRAEAMALAAALSVHFDCLVEAVDENAADHWRVWLVRRAIELVHVLDAGAAQDALRRQADSVGVPVLAAPADAAAVLAGRYRDCWQVHAGFARAAAMAASE